MAVLTLAQYAQLSKVPLNKGIMMGISMEGLIADIMTWSGTDGRLVQQGVRFDEVITPDWIPLGGTISSKTANAKPLSFSVQEMALHIDVPAPLEDANTDQLERASVQQTMLAIKGAAYQLNDAFINGAHATDPNSIEGIDFLVGTMDTRQTVGASEIDLTASYTDALAESLFSRLDLGIWSCEGHQPTFAISNDSLLLKMESFARGYKLLGNTHDWLHDTYKIDDPRMSQRTASTRPAFVYRGVPFYDIGFKADQTTRVLLNTYTEGGSSAHGSRVYFVKIGEEDVQGLQLSPLQTINIGMLPDTDVIRKRIKWLPGLAIWGPRSVVKVQGIRAV